MPTRDCRRPVLVSTLRRVVCVSACAFVVVGCASYGAYTPFSQLPRSEWAPVSEYVLSPGDTIAVRVYEQIELSGLFRIRSDGRISLQLIGEVAAAGKHPADLGHEIEAQLKAFVVTPRVSISLEQMAPVTVTVVGEVANPGNLSVEPPLGVLQAVAQAGGFTDYADKTAIFVVRRTPRYRRIRFGYEALEKNEDDSAAFLLKKGDVIVVE